MSLQTSNLDSEPNRAKFISSFQNMNRSLANAVASVKSLTPPEIQKIYSSHYLQYAEHINTFFTYRKTTQLPAAEATPAATFENQVFRERDAAERTLREFQQNHNLLMPQITPAPSPTPRTWKRLFTELAVGTAAIAGALYVINRYYPLTNLLPIPSSQADTKPPVRNHFTPSKTPFYLNINGSVMSSETLNWEALANPPLTETISCETSIELPITNSVPTAPIQPSTTNSVTNKSTITLKPYFDWNYNEMATAAKGAGKTFLSEIFAPLVPGTVISGIYYYAKARHESTKLDKTKAMMPMIASTALVTAGLLQTQPKASSTEQKGLLLIAAACGLSEIAHKTRINIEKTVIPKMIDFAKKPKLKIGLCSAAALGALLSYPHSKQGLEMPLAAAVGSAFICNLGINWIAQQPNPASEPTKSWTDIGTGVAIAASPILLPMTKLALEATNLYPHSFMNKLPDVHGFAMSGIDMVTSAAIGTKDIIQNIPYKKIGLGLAGLAATTGIVYGSWKCYKKWKAKSK